MTNPRLLKSVVYTSTDDGDQTLLPECHTLKETVFEKMSDNTYEMPTISKREENDVIKGKKIENYLFEGIGSV